MVLYNKKDKINFPTDINYFSDNVKKEVLKVLNFSETSIFNSNKINEFENEFAKYNKTKYSVVLNNCTNAIESALKALKIKGNVLIPSFSYAAVMMAVINANCKPVFADINKETFNIDADDIQRKIKNVNAVIPVHLFGNVCELDKISKICNENNVKLIEDCSHATGAKFKGKNVGNELGVHSFGECKILRICEGGAVTTNDERLSNEIEKIRHEGEVFKRFNKSSTNFRDLKLKDLLYGLDYNVVGSNFRYNSILAAIGLEKLKDINSYIKKINFNANYLIKRLKKLKELKFQKNNGERVYYKTVCVLKGINRDSFLYSLASEGIPVGVYFPVNLAETTIGKRYNSNNEKFINTDAFISSHIILPSYHSLEKEHLNLIVDKVNLVIENLKTKEKINKKINLNKNIKKFYSEVNFTI